MRDDFANFLLKVLKIIEDKKNITDKNFEEKCKELLKFQNCKFVQFNSANLAKNKFNEHFNYDILNWIDGDFIELNKSSEKKRYNFYFNDNEVEALNTQLKQNKSKNLNSKLRDMTVYTSTKMFFYNVTENNI